MHLFRILPVLSLLLGIRASHIDSREPVPHPLDARDTFDVCANINAELIIPVQGGKTVDVGWIRGQFFISNVML